MERFPLVAIAPCAAYFDGLTYACDGEGGIAVTVRVKGEGAAFEELAFRFERAR
jgi:hypothetical protein